MKTIEERESDSDFSEFSETCIEREYKSMNLNPTFSKRNSFNITLTPTFKNIFNNNKEFNSSIDEEESEPFNNNNNRNIVSNNIEFNPNDIAQDKLSLSTLIFYSLPSFGKNVLFGIIKC